MGVVEELHLENALILKMLKDPTKIRNSATKPISPGKPREANMAVMDTVRDLSQTITVPLDEEGLTKAQRRSGKVAEPVKLVSAKQDRAKG